MAKKNITTNITRFLMVSLIVGFLMPILGLALSATLFTSFGIYNKFLTLLFMVIYTVILYFRFSKKIFFNLLKVFGK
ncbi:MAG: hypothetical protein AABY22_35790 [Nanoarchaeota archaeon]